MRIFIHPPHFHLHVLNCVILGITQAFIGPRISPPIESWQGSPLLHMQLEPYVLLGWLLRPWDLWGILFDIVALLMRLQTPSAPSVLSLIPPFGTSCSDEWSAESICLCIWKALTGPLRRQPDQAPFSKHFLASTIMSGDCIWDETPGRTVFG